MPYRGEVASAAQRQVRRLPPSVRPRLERILYGLEENPRPRGSMKLQGHDRLWRVRVGNFRVIYEVYDDQQLLVILRVVQRGTATYRGI